MSISRLKSKLRNIPPILLGAAIYAFGLHYFVIPNELMEGGITGVALLLKYSMNLPPSITTLLLNIPLFLAGWRFIGHEGMFFTIVGTVALSFFLWVMEIWIDLAWLQPFRSEQDYFLATLYAGVTIGVGLGIVLRYGGTTGGSDILARMGNKLKGWSMGQTILIFDVIVIGISLFYIPKEKVLYTLVAVFVASKIIDFITEGTYAAIAFTVISEHALPIADRITSEMDRGVTLLQARGAYSRDNKQVVYCVVYRHEIRTLKELIRSLDPTAFIIINDVHDVLGEGFTTS